MPIFTNLRPERNEPILPFLAIFTDLRPEIRNELIARLLRFEIF